MSFRGQLTAIVLLLGIFPALLRGGDGEERAKELDALERISDFATVELKPVEKSKTELANAVDALPTRDFDLEKSTGLLVQTILLGHNQSLHSELHQMLNRLGVDSDGLRWKVGMMGGLLPNAFGGGNEVYFNLGILPMFKDMDEFASVMAHEMTHSNEKFDIKIPHSEDIEKFLDDYAESRRLNGSQREEIRADLGAVERMIRGKYNPWAYYYMEKKLDDFQRVMGEMGLHRFLYRVLAKQKFDFSITHPLSEVRSSAVKAYIASRGYKEDLSALTSKSEPLPLSLQLLKKRIQLVTAPLHSKMAYRLLKASLAYEAADAAGLTKWETWQKLMNSTPVQSAKETVGGVFDKTLGGIFDLLTKPYVGNVVLYAALPYFAYKAVRKMDSHFRNSAYQTDDIKLARVELRELEAAVRSSARIGAERPGAYRDSLLESLKDATAIAKEFENFAHGASGFDWLTGIPRYLDRASRLQEELLEKLIAETNLAPFPPYRLAALWESLDNQKTSVRRPRFRELLKEFSSLDPRNAMNSNFKDWLGHLDEVDKVTRETPPERVLVLVSALKQKQQHELADRLLHDHFSSIYRFVLSEENKKPKLVKLLADVMGKHHYYYDEPNPFPADKKLIQKTIAAWRKPLADKLGLVSLDREVKARGVMGLLRMMLLRGNTKGVKNILGRGVGSVSELTKRLVEEVEPRNVILAGFTKELDELVHENPQWIKSEDDIHAVLEKDFFWHQWNPHRGLSELGGIFENSFRRFRDEHPSYWRYDLASSERMQSYLMQHIRRLGLMPETPEASYELWKKFSERGVTAVTDELFEKTFSAADPSLQKRMMKEVDRGLIWEQGLRAKIIDQRIQSSNEYQILLTSKNPGERARHLDYLLALIRRGYPEGGASFVSALEKLSWDINSSKEESEAIHQEKLGKEGGKRQEDLAVRALSQMISDAHKWSRSNQWSLIQFLRGDIEPTSFLAKKFEEIGMARIRRLYNGLPVEARAYALDTLLDSPDGLLPKVSTRSGWAKTIIDHVLKNDDPQTQKVGTEVLGAFLHSLKETGNKPLQSYVLSYLLAVPKSEKAAPGHALKTVLEVFGATGIKLGQFLAASGLMPEARETLLELNEQAKKPTRHGMYEDLDEITHGRDLPLKIEELKGAASIKYALRAIDPANGAGIILKVMRQSALAHTNAEFLQLESMAKYLRATYGPKYGVFRSLVRASTEAVKRELSLPDEVKRSAIARAEIYTGHSEPGITVSAPEESLLANRLLGSREAKGGSIRDLPDFIQKRAAAKILKMEKAIYFADKENVYFDPDRHFGNYRFHYDPDLDHLTISPIDFGQVISITKADRENVLRLFSIAQIVGQSGAADWAADKIMETLSLDGEQKKALVKALKSYFPAKGANELSAYFSLLAALEDVGKPQPIESFDFIRGLLQFQQYEKLSPDTESPLAHLAEQVKAEIAVLRPQVKLTKHESFRYGCDVALRRMGLRK